MGRPLADLGGHAVLVALMGKNDLMPSACTGTFTKKAETPSSDLMRKTKDFDYKIQITMKSNWSVLARRYFLHDREEKGALRNKCNM